MSERTNDEWVADLRSSGEQQTRALDDLHTVIASGLSRVLGDVLALGNPEFSLSVDLMAQKTQQHVLEHLNTFDGQSAFITWALKFAVRQALLELRQQRWQGDGFPEIPQSMYSLLERDDFMLYLHRVFKDELLEHQRTAIRSMIMLQMPKEDVMKKLGMERCDYFKMIHDARLRLKRRLEKDGWLPKKQGEENQSALIEL